MVELDELVAYAGTLLAVDAFTDYCPNGLQVQGRSPVRRLVGGVSASQAFLNAAIATGADALVVHHGYFWKGEDPRVVGMKYRRLRALLVEDVSLLAYHLPLDAHGTYGNNVQLAAVLGLEVQGTFGTGRGQDLGLVGRLPRPMPGEALAVDLGERLGRAPLHIAGTDRPVERIAWCTGAAQSFIDLAADQGVDAYLTGEVSEQTVHAAREHGIHFYAAGHHATERYGVQALGRHLAGHFGLSFRFIDVPNPA